MIGIVNLNMSLDKIYMVDDFDKGEVTRVNKVIDMAGGKGTHVANICEELGMPYKLIGFLAGPTGDKVKNLLDLDKMNYEFIQVQGDTRTCLNIISAADGSQTEFLEAGLSVTPEELNSFLKLYEDLCKEAKVMVISGSGFKNMDSNFYGSLVEIGKKHNCLMLVDASGDNLIKTLEYAPYAIKPNKDEVKVLCQAEETGDLIKSLMGKKITMPIISQGGKGALAGYEGQVYQIRNPKVEVVNCVGSGDAFMGGLATGLCKGLPVVEVLKLACACGTANTLQLASGKIAKEDVNRLLKEVEVDLLN